MKLIFMGTPEFAVPALDAVINAGHTVVSVFTQPDKPKGRGLTLTPPPVKVRALELGIPVYQPSSVKDEETQCLIKSMDADCIVVVAYGKLLPKNILCAARYGCVNVHSSLLPKYRGAAPINWAVIMGETQSGVSTMQLDEGMDTGDILLQCRTQIGENETAGELHDRLAIMGAELIADTLEGLENGTITPIKQDDALSSHAPMLDKKMSFIDWTESALCVHNKIRGLSPWPVACAILQGKRIRIHSAKIAQGKGACGEVLSVEPLVIACGEGALEISELQGEGGKRMKASDYLRGHRIDIGEKFE